MTLLPTLEALPLKTLLRRTGIRVFAFRLHILLACFLFYSCTVIFTWIPRSITFHHAPIQGFNTFHLVQRKNYGLYVLFLRLLLKPTSHQCKNQTQQPDRLVFFLLTAHNILLPAGVTSRIALQSLCLWYTHRNAPLSTLNWPSFPDLVLLYCCIDIRTKRNTPYE